MALAGTLKDFGLPDIVQQIGKRTDKDRRVGKCSAIFHVTLKAHQQKKGRKIR